MHVLRVRKIEALFLALVFLAACDSSFGGHRRDRETSTRHNLVTMRSAIDNFRADKQRDPRGLEELVPRYLKAVPKDAITGEADWVLVMRNGGLHDVRSRARGKTLDGVPYGDL
jgi:general secretion pathway protein G